MLDINPGSDSAYDPSITGQIFGFQPFSIHDGPGIRTTVFLKGCPLRCLWCHNPEGISKGTLLSYSANLCIGCRACSVRCPQVHDWANGIHRLDRNECKVCGSCVEVCPAGALEIVGKNVTVEEVVQDLVRDRRYYESSGGGITLSGGEPLLQVKFVQSILKAIKPMGIHCTVETCGAVPFQAFKEVSPFVHLFLFDIKETNPEKHRQYTGYALEPILDNLRKLKELHDKHHILSENGKMGILIRCPIIPTLNDRAEHFIALADISRQLRLPIELLPYHQLGVTKSERMGTDHQKSFEPVNADKVELWRKILRDHGAEVIVS